jgi:hypothetical protein
MFRAATEQSAGLHGKWLVGLVLLGFESTEGGGARATLVDAGAGVRSI